MGIADMGFYTLTIIKFSLGMLVMILQINILGKREFSLNTPLNQVQNYVLGGIIGGVIYNPSVTVLQFLIVLLIWSLVIVAAKLLFGSSGTLRRAIACQPELLVCVGACVRRASPAWRMWRRPSWRPTAGSRFAWPAHGMGARCCHW